MKQLLRSGGAVLGVAATVYFLIFVYRTVTRYDLETSFSGPMAGAIAIAALGYASIVPTSSWAWGRLLRGTGVQFPMLQLNMIMGITQFAKYLPGNIGQHLGRSAMSIRWGMQPGALLVTLAVEMLLAISAAIVVGVLGLTISMHASATFPLNYRRALSLAALCLAIALVGLPAAIRHLPRLINRFAPDFLARASTLTPPVSALGAAFAAYALNYVVIGGGLYAIAFAAADVKPSLPLLIGTFALSWVAGFAVPGAPAGLGVREGAMAALLAPTFDAASALKIIIAFRIATTLGDLTALAWGSAIYLAHPSTKIGSTAVRRCDEDRIDET